MTFTVKIALQPFEVSFEAGSIGEAVAILQEPGNELSKLAALATGATATESEETDGAVEAPTGDKPKRGRRPKNSPDPATAVAPPPLAVPNAATPAPAPVDTSIPAFLDRTGTATTTIAPPPPVPAPAAPAPAAPPPVGVLAGKVVAELKRRGEGAADNGAALVAWLASAGLVVPGATFQEAIDCVSFLSDEKVGPVAQGLNVQ